MNPNGGPSQYNDNHLNNYPRGNFHSNKWRRVYQIPSQLAKPFVFKTKKSNIENFLEYLVVIQIKTYEEDKNTMKMLRIRNSQLLSY